MGSMSICDKCVRVWCQLLSYDTSQSSLADDDNGVCSGGSVCRQIQEIWRKVLFAFAVFQDPTAQNNQYIKGAYFGEVCSATLQWHARTYATTASL